MPRNGATGRPIQRNADKPAKWTVTDAQIRLRTRRRARTALPLECGTPVSVAEVPLFIADIAWTVKKCPLHIPHLAYFSTRVSP